jgi:cyclopropane-fatty-acyl-phospholipid synthase
LVAELKLGGQAPSGASEEAIQAHYDTGNAFYELWLDPTITYSCALWKDDADDANLETAQLAKLDHHAHEASVHPGARVLDIGCGWGSMLARLQDRHQIGSATALTLSKAQYEFVESRNLASVDVRLESWTEHEPVEPYDAIISIGALEHFVRPEASSEERVEIYRHFFERCRHFLKPGGYMSLQTMAYGIGTFTKGALSTIFPESDLPRLSELATAIEGNFEIVRLRNDPAHYARTVRLWRQSMRVNRNEIAKHVSPERLVHYENFLDAGARGYDAGIFNLFRMTLKRFDAGE